MESTPFVDIIDVIFYVWSRCSSRRFSVSSGLRAKCLSNGSNNPTVPETNKSGAVTPSLTVIPSSIDFPHFHSERRTDSEGFVVVKHWLISKIYS